MEKSHDVEEKISASSSRLSIRSKFNLLFFIAYASYACINPYMVLYMKSLGFEEYQIGLLQMINPICSLFFSPLWALVCDTYSIHMQALIVTHIVSTVARLMMVKKNSFTATFTIMTAFSIFRAPVLTLMNFITSSAVGPHSYGQRRKFGSFSYGIFAYIAGYINSEAVSVGCKRVETYVFVHIGISL